MTQWVGLLTLDESNKKPATKEAIQCATCLDSQPPLSDPICHYCVVRTDIPVGLAMAQLLHAAGESSDGNLKPGTYAVALTGGDGKNLEVLANNLEHFKVPIHRVVESHGKYAGQLMAIGVQPGPKSVRGKYLSNLPLIDMYRFPEYERARGDLEIAKKLFSDRAENAENALEAERSLTTWQRIKRWWGNRCHTPVEVTK